jgi:hypothetical protein
LRVNKYKELWERPPKGVHHAANIRAQALAFTGFETPFYNQLDPNNRWVLLSAQIPWDDLVSLFNKYNPPKEPEDLP